MSNLLASKTLTKLILASLLGGSSLAAVAQDRDRGYQRDDHHDQGHDQGRDRGPQHDNFGRQGQNFHFRDQDRSQFQQRYRSDVNRWQHDNRHRRPSFVAGQQIPRGYQIRPVPRSYYGNVPPPPPGYQFGYYNGYVVAYNPTTRIIADVLDLVTGNAGPY